MPKADARRAMGLVGTPFRPQGRDSTGLDCVGVVLRAYDIPDKEAPDDYRLRGKLTPDGAKLIERFFRPVKARQRRAGDLLLLAPHDDQAHFAVQTEHGFVHAHAGLRKVVETPGEPEWPMVGSYRRRKIVAAA